MDPSNLEANADMAFWFTCRAPHLPKLPISTERGKRLSTLPLYESRSLMFSRIEGSSGATCCQLSRPGLWYARQKDCPNAQVFFTKSSVIFDVLKNKKIITTYGTRQYERLKQSTCPPVSRPSS